MASIPRDHQLDSTLALLSEGYAFISNRCRLYGSDIFETRLMLRKAICMMGEEAASIFYHADRFTRVGAMPKTALRLLQLELEERRGDDWWLHPPWNRPKTRPSVLDVERLLRGRAEELRQGLARWLDHKGNTGE